MPVIKFSESAIAKLKPVPGGQQLFWDRDLRGFGVLVSPGGTRTFVAQGALPDGRKRRVTVAPYREGKLEEARDLAWSVLTEFRKGVDPKAHRRAEARAATTLRAVLTEYLGAKAGLAESSKKMYRAWVTGHLDDWLDRPLRSIDADMVHDRYTQIAQSSPATANVLFKIFRALWSFAADRDPGMSERAPTRRIEWVRLAARTGIVTGDQLPGFYAAVEALPNPIARDYLKLLLFTGLRRNEGAGLRWSEVDFSERVIRLPGARTKSGAALDLPLTGFVRDILVARRSLGNTGAFVFMGRGSVGHFTSGLEAVKVAARAAGIELTVHDLRRTFVTTAEACDISPMALKALVNHSLGNGITENYVRMNVERLREPAERVCTRLLELCGVQPVEGVSRLTPSAL